MVGALHCRGEVRGVPEVLRRGRQLVFCLDTSKLAVGICICVVEYDVPDVNYEGGVRHEVYKENLVKIESYERV